MVMVLAVTGHGFTAQFRDADDTGGELLAIGALIVAQNDGRLPIMVFAIEGTRLL
jgi:hypothetical protein